jgi:hypothetical protein
MQQFSLGRVVATPAALLELEKASVNPLELIGRHVNLEPGCLDAHDEALNVTKAMNGGRVFSAYIYADTKYYVITESDRSVTTIMNASDY